MKAKKFEYIKGNTKTNIPWFRPYPHQLNLWKEQFFKIEGTKHYKYWICGGVLENWKTWDIDILVTGKVNSYKELQNILSNATQIGFDHRQLIDINWNDSYEKFLSKGPCLRRSICCEHYYENDTCELQHCLTPHTFESITIASEIIKNEKKVSNRKLGSSKIFDSLWRTKLTLPSKKQHERIKKGIIYKSRPVLLTKNLDFKDIIDWP